MMQAVKRSCKLNTNSRQFPSQLRVDSSKLRKAALPLRIVRLIRDQDQQIPRVTQPPQSLPHAGEELKVLRGKWSFILSSCGIEDVPVDYAVAIKKDRPTCSHFISFLFSRGCETRRCQITA